MNALERAQAPTPKFFRILRTLGLTLLAISGSVIAASVVLPVAVVSVAGYMAVAGGVLSAMSQLAVDDSGKKEQPVVKDGGVRRRPSNNSGRDPEINSG
jgi:hypothetical protein